jgi:hypothetical protein
MNNKNLVVEELNRIQNLFSYKKGVPISEQATTTAPTKNQRDALRLGFGPLNAQAADRLAASGELARKNQELLSKNAAKLGTDPVAARNKSLMRPGETSSDYFVDRKTGEIQVKDLPDVEVTGYRKAKPVQFQTSTGFPLKYQQKGALIGELQDALGVKQTTQFWNATEVAVIKKAKELGLNYNRKDGVDENMFNMIVNKPSSLKPVTSDVQTVTSKTTSVSPTTPQNLSTKAPVSAPSETPEQLFQKLVSSKLIDSLKDNQGREKRRIVYKGPDPSADVLSKMDSYLQDNGYKRIKQKDKKYGEKMVWLKS